MRLPWTRRKQEIRDRYTEKVARIPIKARRSSLPEIRYSPEPANGTFEANVRTPAWFGDLLKQVWNADTLEKQLLSPLADWRPRTREEIAWEDAVVWIERTHAAREEWPWPAWADYSSDDPPARYPGVGFPLDDEFSPSLLPYRGRGEKGAG
jgi:hypothetical protein